ncbi:MAG TPA: hypothetical protein VF756_16615 [Thermoanaerobaculia bacterium]
MSRIRYARIVLVLLVVAALAAPPAWSQPTERPDSLAARVSNAFAFLGDLLSALWAEEGCIADPHGGCAGSQGETPTGDEGCGIDPHGCSEGQGETPAGDEGCWIDPHGGCRG